MLSAIIQATIYTSKFYLSFNMSTRVLRTQNPNLSYNIPNLDTSNSDLLLSFGISKSQSSRMPDQQTPNELFPLNASQISDRDQ